MKSKFKFVWLLSLVLVLATGCQSILKLTYKNKDFEWVNPSNIAKVVIQSTRDKGFRYVVTDAATLESLYEYTSSAMPVEEKVPLEPDYIFEFHSYDNQLTKYFYTAGSDTQETKGNFYNDDGIYVVLNRIDQHLIKNLFSLRKPQDFYRGYYGSILEALKVIRKDHPEGMLGVSIAEDRDLLKFQMSYEILDFNIDLNQLGVHPISDPAEADLGVVIRTQGFKRDLYKAEAILKERKTAKSTTYYIVSQYRQDNWQTKIYREKPEGF